MDLKLPMYCTYNSDIPKFFKTILIIVTVRITIMVLKIAMYSTYKIDIQKKVEI